jgi:hypothetical protein
MVGEAGYLGLMKNKQAIADSLATRILANISVGSLTFGVLLKTLGDVSERDLRKALKKLEDERRIIILDNGAYAPARRRPSGGFWPKQSEE